MLGADGKVAAWTCWVTPGLVLRYHLASGPLRTQTHTVRRGGAGRWDFLYDGKPAGYSFTTRIDGATFTRTTEMNTQFIWSLDDPPPAYGAYKGYLCD